MQYDLAIIGGGPAGYTASIRARQNGLDVVLIEEKDLGGTCLNEGCIPTKALLKSANTFKTIACGGYGIEGNQSAIFDKDAVYVNKDKIVTRLQNGIKQLLTHYKVKLYNGTAELLDKNTIKVNSETISTKNILIATGSEIVLPKIEGIELAMTSRDILSGAYSVPKSVTIIGGGVIGMEFATFFSAIGVEVTIIEIFDRILNTFSEDVSKYASMSLKKNKVKFILGAKVLKLVKQDDRIDLTYILKEKENVLSTDMVIACTGRRARLPLGLNSTLIEYDHNGIVAENVKTKESNIYVAGDVIKGNIQLAHNATFQALSVVEMISKADKAVILPPVPSVVYLETEIACIGISEKQANEEGREVLIGKHNIASNGRSLISNKTTGFIKVVFDKKTETLIGVEIVADNASEIIGGMCTLISKAIKLSDILESCYPHPTVAEGFYEACEDVHKRCIHSIYN